MTTANELVGILKGLDAVEAKALGMDVGKRSHMIGVVLDRWCKQFPHADIDQAISDAVSRGLVRADINRTYLART